MKRHTTGRGGPSRMGQMPGCYYISMCVVGGGLTFLTKLAAPDA